MVAARHLHNWGTKVQILLSRPVHAFGDVPAHQLGILRRLHVTGTAGAAQGSDLSEALSSHELLLDGLIGYILNGSPRGLTATFIRWANCQTAPTLACRT